MRIAYLDCTYGISERLLLAALLDAGADPGRTALPNPHPFSSLQEFGAFASTLGIRSWLRDGLAHCALRLEAAGVALPGSPPAGVESGNPPELLLDPIDLWTLAAAAAALDSLDIEAIYGSRLGLGSANRRRARGSGFGVRGSGKADRGSGSQGVVNRMAVGLEVGVDPEAAVSTPAAVAFLAAAIAPGPVPSMRLRASGFAGTEEGGAGALQLLIGDSETSPEARQVTLLETNIDDMPAQGMDYVMARLFAAGALDVFFTPIQMKKNRPATLLSVICAPAQADSCVEVLLRETTTLGVRMTRAERRCLERLFVEVTVGGSTLPVKAAILDGRVRSVMPEYDACRELAESTHTPLRLIQETAAAEAWRLLRSQGWKAVGEAE